MVLIGREGENGRARPLRWLLRLALALGAALGGAVAAAIMLAVVDLYVTGHGGQSLTREWVALPELGVSLSRADVVVLIGGFSIGVTSWILFGRLITPVARSRRTSHKRSP